MIILEHILTKQQVNNGIETIYNYYHETFLGIEDVTCDEKVNTVTRQILSDQLEITEISSELHSDHMGEKENFLLMY